MTNAERFISGLMWANEMFTNNEKSLIKELKLNNYEIPKNLNKTKKDKYKPEYDKDIHQFSYETLCYFFNKQGLLTISEESNRLSKNLFSIGYESSTDEKTSHRENNLTRLLLNRKELLDNQQEFQFTDHDYFKSLLKNIHNHISFLEQYDENIHKEYFENWKKCLIQNFDGIISYVLIDDYRFSVLEYKKLKSDKEHYKKTMQRMADDLLSNF